MMDESRFPEALFANMDRLHTTALGLERIRKNLRLDTTDVISWCRARILSPDSRIEQRGKNWYVRDSFCEITVNVRSYTVITAHLLKK